MTLLEEDGRRDPWEPASPSVSCLHLKVLPSAFCSGCHACCLLSCLPAVRNKDCKLQKQPRVLSHCILPQQKRLPTPVWPRYQQGTQLCVYCSRDRQAWLVSSNLPSQLPAARVCWPPHSPPLPSVLLTGLGPPVLAYGWFHHEVILLGVGDQMEECAQNSVEWITVLWAPGASSFPHPLPRGFSPTCRLPNNHTEA